MRQFRLLGGSYVIIRTTHFLIITVQHLVSHLLELHILNSGPWLLYYYSHSLVCVNVNVPLFNQTYSPAYITSLNQLLLRRTSQQTLFNSPLPTENSYHLPHYPFKHMKQPRWHNTALPQSNNYRTPLTDVHSYIQINALLTHNNSAHLVSLSLQLHTVSAFAT